MSVWTQGGHCSGDSLPRYPLQAENGGQPLEILRAEPVNLAPTLYQLQNWIGTKVAPLTLPIHCNVEFTLRETPVWRSAFEPQPELPNHMPGEAVPKEA